MVIEGNAGVLQILGNILCHVGSAAAQIPNTLQCNEAKFLGVSGPIIQLVP